MNYWAPMGPVRVKGENERLMVHSVANIFFNIGIFSAGFLAGIFTMQMIYRKSSEALDRVSLEVVLLAKTLTRLTNELRAILGRGE